MRIAIQMPEAKDTTRCFSKILIASRWKLWPLIWARREHRCGEVGDEAIFAQELLVYLVSNRE